MSATRLEHRKCSTLEAGGKKAREREGEECSKDERRGRKGISAKKKKKVTEKERERVL